MERQKEKILEDEPPRSVGVQYATGEKQRNSFRNKEENWTKQKSRSVVDMPGDKNKVWCYEEQYCIGTQNIRSLNQGKLDVVMQKMTRVNINILGISEVKWMGLGDFNSDDHYIYYYGQEPLRKNGVALTVNKTVRNAVLGCNLKNGRIISVHFQGKPFNITVIQVYAPTTNAEEAKVEWFYEDL